MVFTTLTFLVFLPIVFALHWMLRTREQRNALLLVASYVFYGWWDYRFVGLMLLSSLIDFYAGLALDRETREPRRRAIITFVCVAQLGFLGFFKYFDFFAENVRATAAAIGWHLDPVTLRIILPVGISFYTFQSLSYALDVYRRDLPATRRLADYLLFVSFFPQLVAGPIERAPNLLRQLVAGREFRAGPALEGCRLILWGFLKKIALADNLARVVDPVFADIAGHTGTEIAIATVAFGFQIYCDFSAYSDIATGVARLFGVELRRNFAYPYFSQSVTEFWRRWHISLSTWFGDYVFRPLGGSRGSLDRRVRNLLVVFLLSGLWHGAAWTYVAWGLYHGLLVAGAALFFSGAPKLRMTDVPGGERDLPSPMVALRIARTFALVTIGWVFFRAPSLGAAMTAFGKIAVGLFDGIADAELASRVAALAPALVAFVVIEWLARRHANPLRVPFLPAPLRWAAYSALVWTVLLAAPPRSGAFIYFQF
jgi:alginate O-acetyltransferase complex protein AlgI